MTQILTCGGNGIYAVTRDDQGNIWIGSYTGGVSVAILLKHPISILAHEKGNTHSPHQQ
ncbi:two-component regulator propeller domain-containing protein [Candidatus Bacteroides intestinigallinarum]|uniref:two-component regulator propeller domain-containing protein n=1 Tax=Candidatus Bacteroides intestinigallinarum TaxID=2838470 RepID=UPI0035B09714